MRVEYYSDGKTLINTGDRVKPFVGNYKGIEGEIEEIKEGRKRIEVFFRIHNTNGNSLPYKITEVEFISRKGEGNGK